jgi:hypothetical protein
MAIDNVEMPNLCRRSRISSQKSTFSFGNMPLLFLILFLLFLVFFVLNRNQVFQTTVEIENLKHQLDDDLMEKLNELKEKIISETISKFRRTDDIESFRIELNYMFNASLTKIFNQYELNKNTQKSQEEELKQKKDVLNDFQDLECIF